MRLKDEVIVVTGSTQGIGRAIARRCVAEGARVVIHGLEEDLARQAVAELGEDRAAALVADLADPDSPGKLVAFAAERFGKVTALVNNAAIVVSGNIETTDAAFMERVFRINTIAPYEIIRAALPLLKAVSGRVLNIGSVNAWCGEENLLPYSMAKGALMTMTRNLGDSLMREHGIRVNQINPGWVLTDNEYRIQLSQGAPPDWEEKLSKSLAPSGRILRPDEIAAFAVTWLSPESGPVSGQVLDLEQYPMIGRNPPKN